VHRPSTLPSDASAGIRTTNLLERLFVEERRRLKIIPNAFGERAVLKLMFGALIRARLTARKLTWAVGIPRHLKVYPADVRISSAAIDRMSGTCR
jgi:hypothetical protein